MVMAPWWCWIMNVRNSRSEEHTSELQSQSNLVCRLLLEKKKITIAGLVGAVLAHVGAPEAGLVPRGTGAPLSFKGPCEPATYSGGRHIWHDQLRFVLMAY